jgi:centromeric protein E
MDNIIVAVRFRPLSDHEKILQTESCRQQKQRNEDLWKILLSPYNTVFNNQTKAIYKYDHIFTEDSCNFDVFETIAKPYTKSFLEGTNLTIFAFGQTSSGKTYTMRGCQSNPGIIPLTIENIFNSIESFRSEYKISVSYLEVYNEQINDLLDINKNKLNLRDNGIGGLEIERLTEFIVENKEKAYQYFEIGESNRKIGDNSMNEQSSRSHTVFRMKIERPGKNKTITAELNLVDLAGSEGVCREKNEEIRNREGSNINKSLLALSTLIEKLSESHTKKGKKVYLNYRDSKLTRILQYSLSGNSNIVIICNVTPALAQYQETTNTLLFGTNAKKIKVSPQVNEILNPEIDTKKDKDTIKKLLYEIEALNARCKNLEKINQEISFSNEVLKDNFVMKENICEELESKLIKRENVFGSRHSIDSYDFNRSLESAVMEKDQKIHELKEEISKIKKDYQEQYKKNFLQADYPQDEGLIQGYYPNPQKIEELQDALIKNKSEYESNLNHIIKENTLLKHTIESLKLQLYHTAQSHLLISDLEDQNKTLDGRTQTLEARLRSQEKDLIQCKDSISQLEAQLLAEQKKNLSVAAEFEIQADEYQEIMNSYNAQKELLQTVTLKLQSKTQELETSEQKHLQSFTIIEKLTQSLHALQKHSQDLEERLKNAQRTNLDLGEAVKSYEDKSKSTPSPNKSHLIQISGLEEDKSRLQQEILSLKSELESEKQKLREQELHHSHKRHSCNLIDKSMQEQIKSSEKYGLYEKLLELKATVEETNEQNLKLKREIECLTLESALKTDSINKLKKSIRTYIEKIEKLQEDIECLKENKENYCETIDSAGKEQGIDKPCLKSEEECRTQ